MELSFKNVDVFCSNVQMDSNPATINLSQITFFKPFSLIYLGMFLRHHNNNGQSFLVIPPDNRKAREYLTTQKFWERFNISTDEASNELIRISNSTSFNDIIAIDIENQPLIAETLSDQILGLLRSSHVAIDTGKFAVWVGELVDNFARHSGTQIAAASMQYYPNNKEIIFAIGDCGKGIRTTLAYNPLHVSLAEKPHHEAAMKAFEPSVSCREEGGMGLTDVKEEVLKLNGRLTLTTGDGFVAYNDSLCACGEMSYDLPGVQLEVVIPVLDEKGR